MIENKENMLVKIGVNIIKLDIYIYFNEMRVSMDEEIFHWIP